MSTLKVNNLQDINGANNSTPEQMAQGRAKAWINFTGSGTVAIKDSFNVSSITDNGVGHYGVTFLNNMANDDYAVNITGSVSPFANGTHGVPYSSGLFTSNFTMKFFADNGSGNVTDKNDVSCSVFGDQ